MNVNRYDVNYNEIISTDEIELILARYNIGKKPLAKLLGWGETTIIRYLEGDIPTLEYSNKLKSILY
jgi:DNA-directed RNA polymerase subunit H (RpoH/RPB5)